ncbi:HAMP domain-containing histidine kinase [Petralouisia muris]|jgi:signal transduction histidine kinase|uniref:HAMP domain-containing histidine kinase n=1 Tax=Petralouisia muris TaxID=3032872 RepID=A0AC61S1E7_9FIRM|nr:HAMP domain-containing sensor histidine kinase [Petralouisia muris]TGY98230.1 HAMP domain-containing histidine kinase [Petralouisia muris]
MKYSITGKLTAIMLSIVAGTVLLCWFINTSLLEPYYVKDKQQKLLDTFEMVNSVSMSEEGWTEEFAIRLEKQCSNSNITRMIISSDSTIIDSNVGDNETLLLQFLELVFRKDKNAETLLNTEQYMVEKTTDKRLKTEYLVLLGNLPDGNFLLMRTALESIKESVDIANRFLAYVGVTAVILCAVIIYAVTRRITNPILQLAEISSRMTNLDFDAKFQSKGKNEIDILGEHMNQLSETLEQTISELKSANNELKRDIEKKTEIDEMRKEFISNVSHELKTPIALIQGYAEGLKECINDDADSREFYCDVIMDEADKMNQLVKNLLTLNQLESGSDQIVFERFDLIEVIRGVINATAILREQSGIALQMHGNEPLYVWADEFKTEQVLTNYISNAIHYASGEKRIEIFVRPKTETVRVEVFNTGNHIPEEELEHIWDKFYKVDKARTREYGGNGIGLSIVKAIMDSFHRECGVSNEENGVKFWFELDCRSQ